MKKLDKRVISVILLAVILLGGCGKKESEDKSGQMVFHLALTGKLTGFDPMGIRDLSTMEVTSHIMETLYQYHFLKRPYELIPLLAEEMPQISEDRTVYTIKIKKGVYYHDDKCFGEAKTRELRAEDFVYALKRIANIKNLSKNWSLFDDKIIGLDKFREYTKSCESKEDVDYSRDVEGLQCPDDYTLVIKLKRPWPQIVGVALADMATAPIAKEAVDYYGRDIVSHPVGTGPFRLDKWQRGSYVTLVRNPAYRDERYPSEGEPGDERFGYLEDAGKRLPLADRIEFKVIEESQPEWLLFMQGKIDAVPVRKDVYQDVIVGKSELTPMMKQLNIKLKIFEEPSTFMIGFNMLDPVLGKNKPLRRAISYATDRQRFIDLFYSGLGEIAHGFIPPAMPAYDPNIAEKGYAEYNPEKARQLVKEAEKVHGGPIPPLKIAMAGTSTFYRQLGQFMEKNYTGVGLDVELQFMDWPTYLQKLKTRSVQIFSSGWVASMPDAEDFLSIFYSKNWAPGSNSFNYKNEEFDRLYEKVSVMLDSPERRELYRRMQLIVLEDCPAAFKCHRVIYRLHHGWLFNYKQHAFQHGLWKYRRVDMQKRAAYEKLSKKVR